MHLIKAVAAATMLAAMAPAAPAAAQQADHHPMIEGTVLTIAAEGRVEAAPDMATVSLGVTTEGASAQAALQANARRMSALSQSLRRAGVAERDIQTSNVSVNPQYVYAENQPPRVTGYQANNQVSVRVRNLDRLGAIIDGAVAAGGNTVNGVSFGHADPDAQLDAARREAAQAARHRADLYAQAFGMHVQRVIAISEGGGYAPPVPMPVMMRAEAMADAMPTPIAPGEIATSVTISVTYELR
ncbi:MAG: SIMPL domain-containing protein [Hyphomonadaceae bacterium]